MYFMENYSGTAFRQSGPAADRSGGGFPRRSASVRGTPFDCTPVPAGKGATPPGESPAQWLSDTMLMVYLGISTTRSSSATCAWQLRRDSGSSPQALSSMSSSVSSASGRES